MDLAATVMGPVGHRDPSDWQAQSLFDSRRHGGVYPFGPYPGGFCYRQAVRKLIYDPVASEDALLDPVAESRKRLAAWVPYLNPLHCLHGVAK